MTANLGRAVAVALGAVMLASSVAACGPGEESSTADVDERSFCDVVADVNELHRSPTSVEITSEMDEAEVERRKDAFAAQVDAVLARGERLFEDLLRMSPPELQPDVEIVATDAQALARALRDSRGDPFAAFPGPMARSTEVAAAHARVAAHVRSECAVDFLPAAARTAPEPTGTVPTAPPPPPEPPAPPTPPAPSEISTG